MSFKTLPHKNLLISALCAVGMFLFALYVHTDGELFSPEKYTQTARVLPVAEQETIDIDTDRDGLPDWKERLYGSDINLIDSDGDGTGDGDEVRLGRNPSIHNMARDGESPTDKLAYIESRAHATSTTDMSGKKKEFFEKFLAEGSRNIRETTFRDLIKKVDTKKFTAKVNVLKLDVGSDNSTEGIKSFLNSFGTVIKKYSVNPIGRTEDEVIKDTLVKKNSSTNADLQIIAVTYKNFAHDLQILKVPSTLAKAHLLIVNGYQGMSDGLLALENIKEKPMDGAAGYEKYLQSRLDVTKGYALIVRAVAQKGIAFETTEPGYPFYMHPVKTKGHATR